MRTLALLIALSFAAHAQEGAPQEQREKPGFRAQLLERFDADKDGKLVGSEFRDAKQAWLEHQGEGSRRKARQLWVERYDTNGNGQLDQAERETLQRQRQSALAQFDENGDGRLGPREKQALRAQRRAAFQKRSTQRTSK